jgi:hypothetical protein
MKATLPGGRVNTLPDCSIDIPDYEFGPVLFQSLPEIEDTKESNYEASDVIGRTQPFVTYRNSGFRKINMTMHYYVTDQNDISMIWSFIRALQSVVYPGPGDQSVPYTPPAICQLSCGNIFNDINDRNYICAVCTNVGVRYPVDYVWDETTYLPYRVDITTSWYAVYSPDELPGSDMILDLA